MSRLSLILLLALPTLAAAQPPPHSDRYGDPLPTGALARLGTLRLRHEAELGQMQFLPDGKTLVSDGDDGKIRLWEVATGRQVRVFGKSGERVDCFALAPDGKTLAATVFRERSFAIQLWETATGRAVATLYDGPKLGVLQLLFSPDGKLLVSAEDETHMACAWDLATKQPLRAYRAEGAVTDLAFSANGRQLAGISGGVVMLWNVADGEKSWRLEQRAARMRDLAAVPGTGLLATADLQGTIRFWDIATGKQVRTVWTVIDKPNAVAFSPDGRTLATGSSDTTVLVWDLTGQASKERKQSTADLQAAWDDLASPDAARASRAVWTLADAPEQSIPFLRRHLEPVAAPDAERMKRLLSDLDGDDFVLREKASAELGRLGELVEPCLRQALVEQPTLDARKRIERLLAGIKPYALSVEQLRGVRAVEALEHAGTKEARQMLERLAQGAQYARLTREARDSLQRLERPLR